MAMVQCLTYTISNSEQN